jgi:hypothetical protein
MFQKEVQYTRQSTHSQKGRNSEGLGAPAKARLRGGAGKYMNHRQVGLLGWLKKGKEVDEKHDKDDDRKDPNVVTYKGKEIGPPQPTSTLALLPPVSSSARQSEDYPSLNYTPKSLFNNGYDVNGNHIPTPPRQEHTRARHAPSPLHLPPLPPAISTTRSRPTTANPFAGTYGNPHVVRVGPTSPPIDYTTAGSIVDRPSALENSQTGYSFAPVLPRRSPLRDLSGTSRLDKDGLKLSGGMNSARAERKWDRLPDLPLEKRLPEPPLKISNYFGDAITVSTPASMVTSTIIPANNDRSNAAKDCSIFTRPWDVQSCATEDLGVDTLLWRQEQLAQRVNRQGLPHHIRQHRQEHVHDNDEPLIRLPEEGVPNSESIFYVELIDIVKNYHEQRRIVERAFKAGEVSEEHTRRSIWRFGTAMDKTIKAAADMSGYEVSIGLHIIHSDGLVAFIPLKSLRG